MAEVIVNVKANTGQATDNVDNLNKSLGATNTEAENLELTLKKQEATIKTLDGAINLVGGSVEILAAGLATTGLVSEESAEKFQSYTLAAIAFADGSKRVIDGLKNLNEGLQVYGGFTGVARKGTIALFNVIKANPYVAAATAIAGLVAGIVAYITITDDAAEAEKRRLQAIQDTLAEQNRQLSREERLAQARGAEIEELAEIRKQKMLNRLEDIKAERQKLQKDGVLENTARLNELEAEYFDLQNEIEAQAIETAAAIAERDARQAEQAERQKETDAKAVEDAKKNAAQLAADREKARADELAAEKKFLDETFRLQEELYNKQKALAEKRKADRQAINDYEHELLMDEFNATIANLEARKKAGEDAQRDEEERIANINEAISASLNAFSGLAQSLADVQDETSKEGFEAGKKYKIAQVVTSAIQSSFEAFAGAQKFNAVVPGLGTAIGVASVAAIALASQKAIQDIQSAQFGGTNVPNVSVSSNVPTGQPSLGTTSQGGFLALAPPTTSAPPIRAYVVTGDVADGLSAEQQLQTRRRFG